MRRARITLLIGTGISMGLGVGPALAGPAPTDPNMILGTVRDAAPVPLPAVQIKANPAGEVPTDPNRIVADLTKEPRCLTVHYYSFTINREGENAVCGIIKPKCTDPRLGCDDGPAVHRAD